jgi:SMI1 / KNR4 family (SUKH-1)
VRLFREPDAGNPPVRFDEREEETELCQTGLRRRGERSAIATGRLPSLRLFSTPLNNQMVLSEMITTVVPGALLRGCAIWFLSKSRQLSIIVAVQEFLDSFQCPPPASSAAIAEFEKQLGAKFPQDYIAFLLLANGGEGFVGENQPLILWPAEQLISVNDGYRVRDYAPGLLVFGSNGGGDAYGFDRRSPDWRIVEMPFIGMDWSEASPVASTFGAFLKRLYES